MGREEASSSSGASSSGSSGSDAGGDGASSGGLSALSDDFAGAALDPSWSVLHPELVTTTVSGGALRVRAAAQSLWFNASEGPQIHKAVTGDFMVTSRVAARSVASPSSPPSKPIHLGGLMARDATGAAQSYVFVVVGYDENDVSVETKTTAASVSTYDGPSWPSPDAELRICRVGSALRLRKRTGAGAWQDAAAYDRPDLPATLRVGPVIYAYANPPDLDVTFDEVTFAAPTAADCGP